MKLLVDSCVFIDTFDKDSHNHAESLQLLKELRKRKQLITMPAHGMFEVLCTLKRFTNESLFTGPEIAGRMDYEIELIHIDNHFIDRYAMVDIPYIKAGDSMYVVVAKVNGYPLVSSDRKMIEVCKKCSVNVYSPKEYITLLLED